MRDILITLIVLVAIPMTLRWPRIGVMAYIWLSVMNPHRLAFGYAHDVRWALIIAIVTILGLLATKDLKWPPNTTLQTAMIAFFAWTGVTTLFAIHPVSSLDFWMQMMKTAFVTMLIPALFHTRQHLRQLLWVVVLSVAYYGTKGGVFVLIQGGADRVFGPPGSFIEDNNALAVAVIMLIPIMRYLQMSEPRRYVRWACTAMMILCAISALGSYSRGALLAIAAMGAMFWWKGRNKLVLGFVAVMCIPVLINFMPERWHARMDTINTYEEDESANMRLNTWATMFNIAKSRPLTGAGFDVATEQIYYVYSPDKGRPPQVAHSIYFQAMGEHGFVGLALYLCLYFVFWRQASALIRAARGKQELAWAEQFATMSQVMLVGFLVGGAFLSLVNYDVPYYFMGMMLVAKALVDRELKALPAAQASVVKSRPIPALRHSSDNSRTG